MRHLDEGTIHAWLDGALDAEAEKAAEAHAARCTECAVAVADARGMIAAASRILTALDDVPGGVLPSGSRAAPSMPAVALPTVRRWPAWTVRIAASVAMIATGTFVVMRSGVLARVAENDQKSAAPTALPPGVALKSTPAIMPETSAARRDADQPAAPAAAMAPLALDKANERTVPDSGAVAKRPEMQSAPAEFRQLPAASAPKIADAASANAAAGANAPASVALSSQADRLQAAPARAESAKDVSADLEAKKDQAASSSIAQAGKEKTEGAPAAMPASRAVSGSLPPGLRLVSARKMQEDAGVVERRVYELRPGVQVVLAILQPVSGGAEAHADSNSDLRDSARRKLLANATGNDEAAGLNSIQWSDSTGAEFTLSGPIPLDSLRALRQHLPTRVQRP